jgi:hypothetical protein
VSFADALEQNPAPRRLGDVRLRYEPGRLMGESVPPSFWQRQVPGACLLMAVACAVGAGVMALREEGALPLLAVLLGGMAVGWVGLALRLEGRLGRRRFVLHFATEQLRLEQLRYAPGRSRTEWVSFHAVSAVEVVERASRRYALVVVWQPAEAKAPRRAVLVEDVGGHEQEALLRVWRLLHNAFGLKGAGLA